MSFVPVAGRAIFRAGQPPREGSVEFTDERRTVTLPMRAALPVLTRATRDGGPVHPSVSLLAGAALLGMRLVAAGRFLPDESGRSWRVAPLDVAEEDRVVQLARARAVDGYDAATAEGIVRGVLAAVVDAMPRSVPTSTRLVSAGTPDGERPRVVDADFTRRLEERIARARRRTDLPQLVTISLRIEADEEELVAGSVRAVLQVHDADNPSHLCDAALLWSGTPEGHGFGERA
ncbi:MAG TPA: ATP-dependent helicase, partial [Nocardioides sp.]